MQIHSINPATGKIVGVVDSVAPAIIEEVVDRARLVQPQWEAIGFAGRRRLLGSAGARLVAAAEELGALSAAEMGKPLVDAQREVQGCGVGLKAELASIEDALLPEVISDGRTRTTIHRDPLGVVAVITPWNFPVAMPHWLILPALMAGNVVVFKPSEETPLVGEAYAKVLGADLPPGVLQVVHGNEVQGRALVDADIDLVAFTGSREAGCSIMARAASSLKRVVLELGGKDPLIVLGDADVPAAARFAVRNSFRNAGQVCVSTERIYVVDEVADAFEAEVVRQAGTLVQGPSESEGVFLGPMVNLKQLAIVKRQVAQAILGGARIAHQGDELGGNYFPPTVLCDVDHTMEIMRSETFGPVACIQRVRNSDEAVILANDSPFGLGAVVFGTDHDATEGVARRLKVGMVGINRGVGGAQGSPWVGAKQSGVGFHSGKEGHRHFSQCRILSERIAKA